MNYHIVFCRAINIESTQQDSQVGKCPRHALLDLGQRLGASIHYPEAESISLIDRMRAKLVGMPEHWAMARRLSQQLTSEDIIFCVSEEVGFCVAALCGDKPEGPKITVFIHHTDRPRGRVALKLFRLASRVDLYLTQSQVKVDFLRDYLHLGEDRVQLFTVQHTDTQFFNPGSARSDKSRPVIGGGGLEQRDYRTLAAATQDLDVDVRICAVSPDAKALKRTFPDVIPQNMAYRFYDWQELVQLYRDSDVFVITLFDHNYQAGITTLFEAMACRRPIIMTRTPGIVEGLIDSGIIVGVTPGNSSELQQAIINLLNNPEQAEAYAHRGYDLVLKNHNHNAYIHALTTKLESLAPRNKMLV
ncbi:MAG: glycosyltransferase family 4 protein [Nostocaceae cyanobacterium]|nr:glycosyltransferase family 4 protein [Nostocaceae cyanobacterium]